MRILTFTNLFPNVVQPRHGIFIEHRLAHLLAASERLEAKVVAPVPWFPFGGRYFGAWSEFARIPETEVRHGVDVYHPRYPVIPKVGMSVAPILMYRAVRNMVRGIVTDGYDFDVIDAHYFYPDGVAAVMLGRWLGKPVVVSARGTDVNLLPDYAIPRRWIHWAAVECESIITVSQSLKNRLSELGVQGGKINVLRNGVDLDLFKPLDRAEVRQQLDMGGTQLLSVGNLIETKGHDLVIRAIAELPDVELTIVGHGPEGESLRSLAKTLRVTNRVKFIDNLPQSELGRYYNAADVLVLASASEGMPNVVLEAMACGTPVVATDVGGIAEVLTTQEAGELMSERNVEALLRALERLIARAPNRQSTRMHATSFGWSDVVNKQIGVYADVQARA